MFKLNIEPAELSSAMQACSLVIGNQAIDILKAVRIQVSGDRAEFTSTNTLQYIRARVKASGEGVACIDAQTLMAKVSAMRNDSAISIEGDDKFVTMKQGRSKWKMPVLLDDMPEMPEVSGDAVEFSPELLKAIGLLSPVINPAHSITAIQGVWVGGGRVMASDGHQLRLRDEPCEGGGIIPQDAAAKIVKLFPQGGSMVVSDKAALFESDMVSFRTVLIDGQYPDMDSVIKRVAGNHTGSITVDAADATAAARRATSIRDDAKRRYIPLLLRFRDGALEFYAKNSDGEESEDVTPCERTEGADEDIGVNGSYFVSAIQSLEADTVVIRYGDRETAVSMSPLGREGDVRIVMPMRFM